ncbi:MAG: YraN family protein [Rhodobacteraceae bacterium]|nr:YraN family protein [Paracoccaceae bacterium]
MSGAVSYHSGLAAESAVAGQYAAQGYDIAARRWRSKAGEIDLIARKDGNVIFIEVKKSRSFDAAANMLGARQIARLYDSASIFLEGEPKGQLSPARFDVALVDGTGAISILENALMA